MKKLYTILITIVLLAAVLVPLHASFETWGISVRAKGMGDAMAAIHGDANSMMHNPAGLATLRSVQLMPNYNMPLTGLDEGGVNILNASFAAPFVNDSVINWPGALFNLISFGLTKPFFKEGAYGLTFYNLSDELYYERAFSFALGRKLFNFLNTGMNFSVGARFNLFMRGINSNEYTVVNPYFSSGTSSSAFGLDLGVIMHLSEKVTLGAYMNNVIKPDLAINKAVASEALNQSFKYGVGWQVGDVAFMNNLTVAYSYSTLGKDEDDIRAAKAINHFGFEFWQFNHQLAFRAGYEWGDDLSNISLGLSYNLAIGGQDFQLDYAFVMPTTMRSTSGSHLFALVYNIPLSKSYFEFDAKKQKEMKRLEDLNKNVKPKEKKADKKADSDTSDKKTDKKAADKKNNK